MVRERFLGELEQCGKVPVAARAVGVTAGCVKAYVKSNPNGKLFQAKMEQAVELFQSRSVDLLENQALNGIMEPILDKNGHQIMVHIHDGVDANGNPVFRQVPGWKRKYETALRVAVYNRYNPAPKDPSALPSGGRETGVLAVPVPVADVASWGKLVAGIRKAPAVLVTHGEESKK